jgi:hypothetical protein
MTTNEGVTAISAGGLMHIAVKDGVVICLGRGINSSIRE